MNFASRRRGFIRVISCLLVASAAGAVHAGVAYEWRTIDGSGNNEQTNQTMWGAADIQLMRKIPAAYSVDGWEPSGVDRPNPRSISNAVFNQTGSIVNKRGLTDFVWQWGQFLDHDIDLTPDSSGEPFNITVPNGDPVFADGTVFPLNRSKYDSTTGDSDANPRQQMNAITSWIDASNVYGSSGAVGGRAEWLRSTDPTKPGQMKVNSHVHGDLMPFNDGTQDNAGGTGTNLFVGGDIRANEQVGLASMHTLFVREHNRWAEAFASADPGLDSNEVYDRARRVVGAEMQVITYQEFLPALLGSQSLGAYTGYDNTENGSIDNAFSTAFYRLGHSMLSTEIKRLGDDGLEIGPGSLSLSDAFFNPTLLTDPANGGIDPVLRGLALQVMQEIDAKVVGDVRNMLFGPPEEGGLDLVSLNIQRGRDHGLCDYNAARAELGLATYTSFNQITSDTELASSLRAIYGQTAGEDNVDLLDLWVGALSEDHLPGSSVGELLALGLSTQFEALRVGDRFYYENDTDLSSILAELGKSIGDLGSRRLSHIIMDNTGIEGLSEDVFRIPAPATGLLLGLGGILAARRRRTDGQA